MTPYRGKIALDIRHQKAVVDVSGEQYVDHEAQVRAWLMRG